MPTISLNGRIVPLEEARTSALDAGLQHGIGLFETMLGGAAGGEGRVFGLSAHLDRLMGSARELRLSDSLHKEHLEETVLRTVGESALDRARVRLTITAGDAAARAAAGDDRPAEPTVLVVVQSATAYPEEMFDRGVAVAIADARANPLQPQEGHKTLNYWWRLRELQKAGARRAAEALVFQVTNHLCGGCVSNAFIVKNGVLMTPIARGEEGGDARTEKSGAFLPSPVLPGVTRALLLDMARECGLECVRRMLSIDDVLTADEVFLTNSSWGVLPVVKVEAEAIGQGVVGEWTRRFRAEWLRKVEEALEG